MGHVDLGLVKPKILTKTVETLDDETPNLIETWLVVITHDYIETEPVF